MELRIGETVILMLSIFSVCSYLCVLEPGDCTNDCGEGTQNFTGRCGQLTYDFELPCTSYTGCTGRWGDWTAFGECSTSCDGGQKLFTRTCNHVSLPGHLSVACDGENYEYKTCNLGGCPGSWSCWEDDGHCSTSCGNGTQIRRRCCDNLAPTNVGNECPGDNVTYVHCNIIECPVYKWGHLKEQNLTKDDLKDIMEEELNEIKNNLAIDSKNISATIRKHISARDDRPSAASVGYVGVALLVVPLVMIILADAPKVFAVVASIYRKVCSRNAQ
ncbi:coadhesin-like [Mytilus edulis]|uniref:coadhesin-like n=1 Tax=Mytilus edulis TaxID=6550 RepID=UPI0039EE436C